VLKSWAADTRRARRGVAVAKAYATEATGIEHRLIFANGSPKY
jgi:hypothetical protein